MQTLRKASSSFPNLERQHVEALVLSMQKAPILKKHGKKLEVGAVESKTVSNYPFPAIRSSKLLTEGSGTLLQTTVTQTTLTRRTVITPRKRNNLRSRSRKT